MHSVATVYNLGQNSLGKCDALLSPLPPFQRCFKKRPKACTVFCITLSTLVWGEGGRANILFVSACQMMLKLEFFPRVLSKIVECLERGA